MDVGWDQLTRIISNWDSKVVPLDLSLARQHDVLFDCVRDRMVQYPQSRPSSVSHFFTHIKRGDSKGLTKDKYFELIETLEKVDLLSHGIVIRLKAEYLLHMPRTEIEFRLLLIREQQTPAQFIRSCMRNGCSDEFLFNIFTYTPILLDPSELSADDYKKLIQSGIDINSERNFVTQPLIQALNDENVELFKLLMSLGANVGVLFKRSNLEKTLAFVAKLSQVPAMTLFEACLQLLLTGAQTVNNCKIGDHLCFNLSTVNEEVFLLLWPFLEAREFTLHHVHNRQTLLSEYLTHATVVNTKVIDLMINAKVPLDEGAPLAIAMEKGFYEVVKLLVTAGANPNQQYKTISPISLAIQHDDLDFLRFLRSKKASFDVIVGNSKEYLVNWAINTHRLDIFQIVLDSDHDFSNTAHYPVSPMSCAFRMNLPEVMQQLYDRKASIDCCFNSDGDTPLTLLFRAKDFARFSKSVSSKKGSSGQLVFPIDIKNGRGETCLYTMLSQLALSKEKWIVEFIQFALGSGANLYEKANNGTMPIHLALRHIPQLIEPNAIDLSQLLDLDDEGMSPIDVAFDIIEAARSTDGKDKKSSAEGVDIERCNRLFIKHCLQKLKLTHLAELREQSLEMFSRAKLSEALVELVISIHDVEVIKECLEISVVLNLRKTSLNIAKSLKMDMFVRIMSGIIKSYPAMTQRYYLNHVIYNDLEHLTVQPTQVIIPQAPETVDYKILHSELKNLFALASSMPANASLESCQERTKLTLDKLQDKVERFFLALELALTEQKAEELKKCFSAIKPLFVDLRKKNIPLFNKDRILLVVKKHFEHPNPQLQVSFIRLIELIDSQLNGEPIKPDTQLSFGVWEGLIINEIKKFLRLGSINNPTVFYAYIINNLRHLTLIYEEFKKADVSAQCEVILTELIIIASECSNRWLTGSNEQLLVYKFEQQPISFEDFVISEFNKLRIGIAQSISGTESHRTTQINAILADTMKLWGFDIFVGQIDTNIKKDLNEETARIGVQRTFSYAYNPGYLVHFTSELLTDHMTMEGQVLNHYDELSVIRWFKSNPLHPMEAREKRKEAEPDEAEIFADITLRKLHVFAIVHFLKHLHVVKETHEGVVQALMEALKPSLVIKIRRQNRIDED